MPAPRPFALIRTHDQWRRLSHDHTSLEGEVIRLSPQVKIQPGDDQPFVSTGAGLAFDGHCRLYHSIPAKGRVTRIFWAGENPLQPQQYSVNVLQVREAAKRILIDVGEAQGISRGAKLIVYEPGSKDASDEPIAMATIIESDRNEAWADLTMLREASITVGDQLVLVDPAIQPLPMDLFEPEVPERRGDFTPAVKESPASFLPGALAVDDDERLFIADLGTKRIVIFDLWSNRLLRQVPLAASPIDLVADGRQVWALLASPPGLIKLDARSSLRTFSLPAEIVNPSRLAISPHRELYLLENAGTVAARVFRLSDFNQEKVRARLMDFSEADPEQLKFATDLEFQLNDPTLARSCKDGDSVLVLARRPADGLRAAAEDFVRYCVGEEKPVKLRPLTARGYDGGGIVRVPEGRIGFWTPHGFRHAVAARVRYHRTGSVTTFQLDSGEFQTIWGRLFLDACIPKDTEIVVRCITADELPAEIPELPRPPDNMASDLPWEDSPPMPPPSLLRKLLNAPAQSLHRRATGYELPWVRRAEDDPFETYEAPVLAGSGRYLWVRIDLTGNTRGTPQVKALRAEYPTHDYLRRLPKVFSRDEQVASFLRRYLALFEGQLGELEAKAEARATLLDWRSAPAEILPWLASFVGLLIDERMARAPRPGGKIEDVRRTLIGEATWLFRRRGTVPGLQRFVELYLDQKTILIEKYRVRGLGGAMLPDSTGLATNSILGAGFRVGGSIGQDETQVLGTSIDDAFETHAHRFSLIIPASLTSEQLDVVHQILDLHRPAHTLVEVCTVAAGMRVGRGLHVELTSIIGRSGGFTTLQLGSATLGRGGILGRPGPEMVIGGSRLGRDGRVG